METSSASWTKSTNANTIAPDPTVADGIASATSQTDQLIARLENAMQRLRPTPQKAEGGVPTSSGLVQQSISLLGRIDYAVKLAEEVCGAVGI